MLRLIFREIRHHWKFSVFFLLNLSLGLTGFITLEAFKTALRESIDQRAKSLISADVVLSKRQAFSAEELKNAETILRPEKEIPMADLFSMVAGKKNSRLVQLRAVAGEFPFYGDFVLKRQGAVGGNLRRLQLERIVWIYPELAVQLGVQPGDSLKIGEASFVIDDIIQTDAAPASVVFSLAPRIYLGWDQLAATHLIQRGSTVTYSHLYRLPVSSDAEALGTQLDHALQDPAARVRTPRTASDQIGRLAKYLNDYLGLAALVAFFLSSLGAAYLFRSFLFRRLKEIAILLTLGLTHRQAQFLYVLHLAILGAAAAIPASLASGFLLPLLTGLLQKLLPFSLVPAVSAANVLVGAALGTVGSLTLALPLLAQLSTLSAAGLFQESELPRSLGTRWVWYLPAVVFYWALAVALSKSWVVGNTFIGCLLGAALIIAAIGVGLVRLASRAKFLGFTSRLALRTLERQRVATLSCFLAISLGTLLINLIAQTQDSLQKEIHLPEGAGLPSLFLFDIQEEQVVGLEQYLKQSGLALLYLSPMIRARLQSVNGQVFEKEIHRDGTGTREEEADRDFRNRGVNLTYRATLTAAEEIVAGEAFGVGQGVTPAPISVEKEFAARLRLRLGDRLSFDVQGVPVAARVASLRKIRWNRFQPNFFIQFPTGYLEEAPKTFLGALPAMDWRRKAEIQNGVVERFPNVSLIDVTQVMEKIASIVAQMAWALRFMAWLALFSGGVVLFSIANHQAQQRQWDLSLLKVLGASFPDLRTLVRWEFGWIGLVAASLGAGLALVASYTFSVVLEYAWFVTWWQPLASIVVVTFFTVTIGQLATRRILRRSPLLLLQTARTE